MTLALLAVSVHASVLANQPVPLTVEEAILFQSICPTGFEVLPPELAPQQQQPSIRQVRSRTSDQRSLIEDRKRFLRVAAAPRGDWLVRPEDWYAPEDRQPTPQPKPPVVSPPVREPALEEPARPVNAPPKVVAPAPPTVQPSPIVEPEPTTSPVAPSSVAPSSGAPRHELLLGPTLGESTPSESPLGATQQKTPANLLETLARDPVFTDRKADLERTPESLPNPLVRQRPPLHSQPKPLSPHGSSSQAAAQARQAADGKSAYEAHAELYAKNCFPSARDCAECHQQIYDDWSVSSHAYAFVSPMFHKFEQRLTDLSQGTVGFFCYRCHSPVGTTMAKQLGFTRATPTGAWPEVAREGVTCIACHRVNERYAKTNGERRIVPGDLTAPVYGGVGGDGVAAAIAQKDKLKIKLSAADKRPGQLIHNEGRFFDQLTQAEACTSCHQVAVHPGIKLEVVWEQYRASPACKKGVSCQDCHMGRVPGLPEGYNCGPIAEMSGKTVNTNRKQSSHLFHGPGYSIAHPGLFPQHKDASRWSNDEWLAFDWRAGWGTDDFEDAVADAEDAGQPTPSFPKVWEDIDDRYDAREIIEDNLKRLERKRQSRELVMENGSHVDGPFFHEPPTVGRPLRFDYVVANKNEGHNLPTASLGAQPQLWANVVLIGPRGRRLWETGYTDSKGDLCDIHSEDVRQGRAPFDSQLFNLQTMFLITGVTGTDREFPLPVNFSFDQVPHLRPGTIPISVTNHPPFIRMESRSIAPLGKKRVKYKVPAELMCQPGRYRLSFRLRSRTEPMYFMRFCNATPEMLRSMTEGILDIHPFSVEFEVK